MKVHKIADEAAELYESGLSIDAVAKELNIAYRTARKAIRAKGVPTRDPSARLVGRTRPDKAAERAEAARYAATGAAIPDATYIESLRAQGSDVEERAV